MISLIPRQTLREFHWTADDGRGRGKNLSFGRPRGKSKEDGIYIPFLCLSRLNWIYAAYPSSGSRISKPPLQLGMATWSRFRPYRGSAALGSHFFIKKMVAIILPHSFSIG